MREATPPFTFPTRPQTLNHIGDSVKVCLNGLDDLKVEHWAVGSTRC
jgi:hypothetical protein